MLDPRFALSQQDFIPQTKDRTEDNFQSVCGETFKGTQHGYPFYQEGFVIQECDYAQPITDLITVVLNAVGMSDAKLRKLNIALQGIRNYSNTLPVILASSSNQTVQLAKKFNDIQLIPFGKESVSAGKVWNKVLKIVKTPYTLIARDIIYFNSYARLERQIRVINSIPSIGVAGGAFRNLTGHWKVGCHQSEIKNYFLKYFEGYRYSAHDCMFCDYLEGPFVAKTSILHDIPFSEELPSEIVLDDWFLQLKQADILVLNCPDVMYFTWGVPQSIRSKRETWAVLARQWEINRIYIPPNTLLFYSCKEVGLTCKPFSWAKSYLLPSCCLVQIARAFRAFDTFSKEKFLRYEIEAGSVLGAVKLRSFMPWDLDGDVTFESKDYVTFYKAQNRFRNKGFKLDSFEEPNNKSFGYFLFHTPDIYFEMWGFDKFSTMFLPSELRRNPTKVNVHGVWINAQSNPGLYARNRYGPNYLKHAQSWIHLGMKSSWDQYNSGRWLPCPKRYHHACLDHYSVDGNTDFIQQFLH